MFLEMSVMLLGFCFFFHLCYHPFSDMFETQNLLVTTAPLPHPTRHTQTLTQ